MNRIPLKSPDQIKKMRRAGQTAGRILQAIVQEVRPGITTNRLEQLATELLQVHRVKGAFKGFEGYPYNLVVCLNEEVVHGMPSTRILQPGDLLTLDFGVYQEGFYGDTALTVEVGDRSTQDHFLEVGRLALDNAIQVSRVGNRLGDIGYAIQSTLEPAGYSVVRAFVGHGIGRELHEEPAVPGFGKAGEGVPLQSGMVLAIEVMYTQGDYAVEVLSDGWTVVTRDGSLSGMFEHTVAITESGPKILTLPSEM